MAARQWSGCAGEAIISGADQDVDRDPGLLPLEADQAVVGFRVGKNVTLGQ